MEEFDCKKNIEIHIKRAKKAVENYQSKILQLNSEINEWQMFLEDLIEKEKNDKGKKWWTRTQKSKNK